MTTRWGCGAFSAPPSAHTEGKQQTWTKRLLTWTDSDILTVFSGLWASLNLRCLLIKIRADCGRCSAHAALIRVGSLIASVDSSVCSFADLIQLLIWSRHKNSLQLEDKICSAVVSLSKIESLPPAGLLFCRFSCTVEGESVNKGSKFT